MDQPIDGILVRSDVGSQKNGGGLLFSWNCFESWPFYHSTQLYIVFIQLCPEKWGGGQTILCPATFL